ncbi:hypothetical protein [Leptolyngbya sp. 7M]|uniref:hypothetical protein n=1 Tax=Leptolyngbya sp. 7M TaxID=2812896 RepID=UPI001B8B795D|nr:hypothetical protein [Leptolyngbya sp. 7M]QYO65511.1 hypothetical protein JVX88_01615 [Leptolyngbya sp. 7M]
MNYFNYFTEIEDTFVRRRGKNLLLSPLDWAMIETWQERGIPLHIVLRGIETVFDNFEKNPRPRTIKSLVFCKEEVEALFQEWAATQIGKAEGVPVDGNENDLSREVIRRHISSLIEKLREVAEPRLGEAIDRATKRLIELNETMADRPEQIDGALSDIEGMLEEAMLSNIESVHLKKIEKEVAGELRQYKSHMEKSSYQRTHKLMLLKRLREHYNIPRLTLFYL